MAEQARPAAGTKDADRNSRRNQGGLPIRFRQKLQDREADPSRAIIGHIRSHRKQPIQPMLFGENAPGFVTDCHVPRGGLHGGRPAIDVPSPNLGQLPELIERHAYLLAF